MVACSDICNDYAQIQCHMCQNIFTVFYHREDMVDWLSGSKPIQDAMPYLSAADRELFLSQLCGDCFDKLFASIDTHD